MATNTIVQAKVTKTAAFVGTTEIDISGITGDWTLVLEVSALAASNVARFSFQDTVDNFSNFLDGPSVSFSGETTSQGPRRVTFQKHDFPALRFGTASAELRLSLTEIKGGSSQSVTYSAWIET